MLRSVDVALYTAEVGRQCVTAAAVAAAAESASCNAVVLATLTAVLASLGIA